MCAVSSNGATGKKTGARWDAECARPPSQRLPSLGEKPQPTHVNHQQAARNQSRRLQFLISRFPACRVRRISSPDYADAYGIKHTNKTKAARGVRWNTCEVPLRPTTLPFFLLGDPAARDLLRSMASTTLPDKITKQAARAVQVQRAFAMALLQSRNTPALSAGLLSTTLQSACQPVNEWLQH